MRTATERLEFAPPPTRGMVRALGLAILAHAVLLAALTWGVHWKRESANVTAEAELWSALPQQAAPKPIEAPPEPPQTQAPPVTPAPVRPAPPPQVQPKLPDVDIALEREKLRLKKKEELDKQKELDKQRLENLKQEKLQLEKKRVQDQREQDKKLADAKKAAEDRKKAEQDSKRKEATLTQQDAKKLEAMRQENIKRITGLAGATGAPGATGTAQQSSGPSAGYAGRIRASIKPNIVFTDEIVGNPMAEVEVRTAPDGTIISRKLLKPSGDKSWDDAVLRAIDKTEKLPRDVDGRVPPSLEIRFKPKD